MSATERSTGTAAERSTGDAAERSTGDAAERSTGAAVEPIGPRWSPDAPASESDILIALRFADRAARKAVGDELAGSGVHTGQELVLAKLLHLGSLPVAQLAKVLDVEVPTATRATQRMEAAGLVRRVKNDKDARQVSIELTDHGTEVARTVRELHAQAGRRALSGITAEDRRLLRNLLWTITANIEDLPS